MKGVNGEGGKVECCSISIRFITGARPIVGLDQYLVKRITKIGVRPILGVANNNNWCQTNTWCREKL